MDKFEFIRRHVSKGMMSYAFENPFYRVTIYMTDESDGKKEILYPVDALARSRDLDVQPDVGIISIEKAELNLPPSISMERLPQFQKYINASPDIVEAVRTMIRDVEAGKYD